MTSRMFSFITKTWNPIAGGFAVEDGKIYACPFRCSFCWATSLINKFPKGNLGKKYTGHYRIHEKAMKPWFKAGEFIFVQCMSDIGASGIPSSVIDRIFKTINSKPDLNFLLLTKSDTFYIEYMHDIPNNCICGITMETDLEIPENITHAPHPQKRLDSLVWLKSNYPHMKTFISIEPIMPFSENFARKIKLAEPWKIAIGYDNYENHIPEPLLDETVKLIFQLQKFTKVNQKTIRKAWHEEADG